ncbi:MAG: transposase [bacterium]
MARPLRIEYTGALYHVMSRGNAYQDIFRTIKDRKAFLNSLADCIELHNLICHAYCLMDNHYHLLIETPDANLSKAMRDINGNYTQKFHKHNGTIGHILQGRYKANLIEKESYFLEVVRYIVNNPVKEGLVENPAEWLWSSYNQTRGSQKKYDWLTIDFTLGCFSEDVKTARKLYEKFVQDRINAESPYKDLKNNFILGSQQFIDWVWDNHSKGSECKKEIPRKQRIVGRPSLEELFDECKSIEDRNKTIIFARYRCGYLTSEIAKHIGLERSVVGRISRKAYNNTHNTT